MITINELYETLNQFAKLQVEFNSKILERIHDLEFRIAQLEQVRENEQG